MICKTTALLRQGIDHSDTKESVFEKLRNFLVAKWRRLSPVLSAYDRDSSGPILAVQLTNALRMLDFAPTERCSRVLRRPEDGQLRQLAPVTAAMREAISKADGHTRSSALSHGPARPRGALRMDIQIALRTNC
jgi:hypothetical protein